MGLLDVRAFWLFLRRRARLIGLVTALTVAAAAAALMVLPARYTATAVVLVDPRQQRVVQSEAVLSGIGSDAAAVESQVEILKSTPLARRVVAQLKLETDPAFGAPPRSQKLLGGLFGDQPLPPPALHLERVVSRLQQSVRVQRRGLTYVLEIDATAGTPDLAARIANAYADGYLAEQKAAKRDATMVASDWLSERAEDLRKRVGTAERAVAEFKARNNIVDTGEGRTLTERQVSELNQQLILARARTAEARARLDQVKKSAASGIMAGALPEALQSPVVANLRAQYAEAGRRQAEMASNFGPRHPSITTIRAETSDLRAQIDREVARISAGLRNDFEAAQSREQSLEASLTELKKQSATVGEANVRLRELEREAQVSRTVLEQFMLRAKETSEQETLQRPDARIVSPAVPPLQASQPRPPLLLGLGLLGGLVLGIGAATLAETLARGFRTAREVEAALGRPVLGSVPLIGSWPEPGAPRWRRFLLGRDTQKGPVSGAAQNAARAAARRRPTPRPERLVVEDPLTPFAEAIRCLRTRLRSESDERARVMLVTSALPGEGKSTLAHNLAQSLAKSGVSTLLIEADIRKNVATPWLPRTATTLLDLLENEGRARGMLYSDPVSELAILPAGRVADVAAAAERLASEAMLRLVEHFRKSFDIVILDGPPLLPFVDSRDLIELADSALMVVEWSRTSRDLVEAALDTLGPNADKVVGAVLNKVDLRSHGLDNGSYGYMASYAYAEAARPR